MTWGITIIAVVARVLAAHKDRRTWILSMVNQGLFLWVAIDNELWGANTP